jgi:hypothetical protein
MPVISMLRGTLDAIRLLVMGFHCLGLCKEEFSAFPVSMMLRRFTGLSLDVDDSQNIS